MPHLSPRKNKRPTAHRVAPDAAQLAQVKYRLMTIADHPAASRLWARTEGMCLEPDDRRAPIQLYLNRNRGLCFVAYAGSRLVGTVLCGHDGRRALLRHLAVEKAFRRNGIARELVRRCVAALARQDIPKCNVFVMYSNTDAVTFWEALGFRQLGESFHFLQVRVR